MAHLARWLAKLLAATLGRWVPQSGSLSLRNRRRSEMADRWTSVGIRAIEVERLAKLGR